MNRIKMRIGAFLRQPKVTVCLGILVCVCGLSEMMEEIIEGYEGTLQAEHGVLAFGIITVLKGLTELAEGIELVTIEIEEVEREEAEDTAVAGRSAR